MKLVSSDDPILFTPSVPIMGYGVVWSEYLMELQQVMAENSGVGISAIQVGDPYQIIIIRKDINELSRIFLNPKILDHSRKTTVVREGCLSFPGEHYDVERPSSVTISYIDAISGKRKKSRLSGTLARVFLHEFEHLQGKTFHR